MKTLNTLLVASALVASVAFATATPQLTNNNKQTEMGQMQMMDMGKTGMFKGVEVNGGSASLYSKEGRYHLKWSDDFKIPGTPSPSWQVVDAQGNTYLLNQLKIAGEKQNRDIVLPKYIKSIAKVQIWCSFAEVNLGEASFSKAVMLK